MEREGGGQEAGQGEEAVKRYVVFAGDTCNPGGGAEDYRESFDDIEQARAYAKGLLAGDFDWAHIWDNQNLAEPEKVLP